MPDAVRLSCPADYIAIVPYLLGFHPMLSLVTLAFADHSLVYTARYELADAPQPSELAAHSRKLLTENRASEVCVIGYGPGSLVTPAMDAVRESLASTDIMVTDLLRCEDSRYWSYLDAAGPDNSPDGTPYDITTNHAAVGAIIAGLCAQPDRMTFAACLAPVEGSDREAVRKATRIARRYAESLLKTAPPRYWYDEGRRCLHAAFACSAENRPIPPAELAWLGVLLTAIVVRDTAILMVNTYAVDACIKLWTEVVRRVEPGYVAAPAALLAQAAYGCGAGSLASVALERALSDAPRYSLAMLLHTAFSHGVPPSAVQEIQNPDLAEAIEAQVEHCPRAVLPRLPEGR